MLVESVSRVPITSSPLVEPAETFVTVDMQREPVNIAEIVNFLVSMEGELNVCTWYEGPNILTIAGAIFLQENFFEPLYRRKPDAKAFAYCLEAWNFLRNVNTMKETTPKGDRINKINKTFVECIYASSFFKFCTQFKEEDPFYKLVNEELPQKQWLLKLSANRTNKHKTIAELFEQQPSLLDSVRDRDVSKVYSMLQYLEGYYLIREVFKRGLEQQKQKIQLAFVLPNNEAEYYGDNLAADIQKMLKAEFGEGLKGMELNIYFKFYQYNLSPRPYLGPIKGPNVRDRDINRYFNYLNADKKV